MGTAGTLTSKSEDVDDGDGSAEEASKEDTRETGIMGLPATVSTCGTHRTFLSVGTIATSICGSLVLVAAMAGGSKPDWVMDRLAVMSGANIFEF